MAEDKSQKTERPTPTRRRKARRQGRVAHSAELGSWLSLGALVLALPVLGRHAVTVIADFLALATSAMSTDDPTQSVAILGRGLWSVVEAAGPLLLVAGFAAAFAGFGQVGLVFAPEALGFKWNKISPVTGFKRIFSPGGAWETAKVLMRLGLLVAIGFFAGRHLLQSLLGPGTLPIQATVTTAVSGLLAIVRDVVVVAVLLALADYAVQRHRLNESLKMSKDEVRRELREMEGSPEMRRALRRRRRRLTRMQILAAVSQADVIVVNPTHYSVGLRYDRARDKAPRVVTKGDEDDALAIRAAAIEQGVPVVENPPVARSLFSSCEVGDVVPAHLYEVVARLLAFVYRLSPAARALVDVHKMAA